MILDLYYARRFLGSFLLVAAVFLSLILLVDLIEQLRRFSDSDTGLARIFALTLLSAPGAIDKILPLLMILATIALFVAMARSSELVVTRAAGRSGLRTLVAPLGVAALIGVLAVTMLNPIVATTANRYQRLSDIYRSGDASTLSLGSEGLWLRQGGAEGQAVIHAEDYLHERGGITLRQVTILGYGPSGEPNRRILAESARLGDDEWILENAKVWPLASDLNPEHRARTHAEITLATTLTQARIEESLGRASGISIYDLPATIRELREAGFATRSQEVWFQSELARPLFLIAMVLVGAAFTMRHTRLGGTGVAVIAAVLLGFGLYFIRDFAQVLGENGQLPVILATWAPPIAAILLALGLLLQTEDG